MANREKEVVSPRKSEVAKRELLPQTITRRGPLTPLWVSLWDRLVKVEQPK